MGNKPSRTYPTTHRVASIDELFDSDSAGDDISGLGNLELSPPSRPRKDLPRATDPLPAAVSPRRHTVMGVRNHGPFYDGGVGSSLSPQGSFSPQFGSKTSGKRNHKHHKSSTASAAPNSPSSASGSRRRRSSSSSVTHSSAAAAASNHHRRRSRRQSMSSISPHGHKGGVAGSVSHPSGIGHSQEYAHGSRRERNGGDKKKRKGPGFACSPPPLTRYSATDSNPMGSDGGKSSPHGSPRRVIGTPTSGDVPSDPEEGAPLSPVASEAPSTFPLGSPRNVLDHLHGQAAPVTVDMQWQCLGGEVKKVGVTGSFDRWREMHALRRTGEDTFGVRLTLYPGSYHIRYYVDGYWKVAADQEIVKVHDHVYNQLIVNPDEVAAKGETPMALTPIVGSPDAPTILSSSPLRSRAMSSDSETHGQQYQHPGYHPHGDGTGSGPQRPRRVDSGVPSIASASSVWLEGGGWECVDPLDEQGWSCPPLASLLDDATPARSKTPKLPPQLFSAHSVLSRGDRARGVNFQGGVHSSANPGHKQIVPDATVLPVPNRPTIDHLYTALRQDMLVQASTRRVSSGRSSNKDGRFVTTVLYRPAF